MQGRIPATAVAYAANWIRKNCLSAACFLTAALCFVTLSPRLVTAETPAEQLQRAIKNIFAGSEFKDFQFYSPVKSRWGLGTMFEKSQPRNRGRGPFIGDSETWWAAGLSDKEKSDLLAQLFVRGELGIQRVVAPVSTKMEVKAALPIAFWKKLITIEGDISRINNSSVTITAVSAEERELSLPAFFRAATTGKLAPEIVARIKKADYQIVTKDVVFFGFEATTEGAVQTVWGLDIEALPSDSKQKTASAQSTTPTAPIPPTGGDSTKGAAGPQTKNTTTTKDAKATDGTGQPPKIASQATLQFKSAADIPMVVAVYLADAPKLPPEGALSNPTTTRAQISADAFSRLVDSLEEKRAPPRGVIVVQKSAGR